MKKIFCMAIIGLLIFLSPVLVLAKDTGICNTSNELFYHSMVGAGLQQGISIENFSQFETTKQELANQLLTFRYPDNDMADVVNIALFSNADGFTDNIVIDYKLVNGVTPVTANTILNLCAKSCFITDSELATVYSKARSDQYDYNDGNMRIVSFYSSINRKMLSIAFTTKPNDDSVTFIFSSQQRR